MVLHMGQSSVKADYLISDYRLSQKNKVCDLGFLVTENLNLEKHC